MSRRIRRRSLLLAGIAAALVAVPFAGTASAQCYSSTPNAIQHADSPIDGDSGLAPELGTLSADIDAACRLNVDPGVLQTSLYTDDSVFVYLNTDGNAATGSTGFDGADLAVGTLGSGGPSLIGSWDAALGTMSFSPVRPVQSLGVGGFTATLDELGIGAPVVVGVRAGSMWSGVYDDYFDFSPEPGMPSPGLPIAFSSQPPVAPVPPAPAPAPAPVVAQADNRSQETPAVETCTVPRLKRKTLVKALTALNRAGCRIGKVRRLSSRTVGRGRVLRSNPGASSRTSKRVTLTVSRGKRKRAKARAAAVSVSERLDTIAALQVAHGRR